MSDGALFQAPSSVVLTPTLRDCPTWDTPTPALVADVGAVRVEVAFPAAAPEAASLVLPLRVVAATSPSLLGENAEEQAAFLDDALAAATQSLDPAGITLEVLARAEAGAGHSATLGPGETAELHELYTVARSAAPEHDPSDDALVVIADCLTRVTAGQSDTLAGDVPRVPRGFGLGTAPDH